MTASKPPKTRTRYFNWEGDACQLHELENGDQSADIYRAGKGLLPTAPADLLFKAKEISATAYQELVNEEIALNKRNVRKA
jgi:hypothetical protein